MQKFRRLIAIVFAILVFIFGLKFVISGAMKLTDTQESDVLPVAMIQCFGGLWMWGGSLLFGIVAIYTFVAIDDPPKFIQGLRGLWQDLPSWKWIILGVVGILIGVPSLIWWMCVDMTPWFILFLPGIILSILTGKRR